jgi:hypothetical protein
MGLNRVNPTGCTRPRSKCTFPTLCTLCTLHKPDKVHLHTHSLAHSLSLFSMLSLFDALARSAAQRKAPHAWGRVRGKLAGVRRPWA